MMYVDDCGIISQYLNLSLSSYDSNLVTIKNNKDLLNKVLGYIIYLYDTNNDGETSDDIFLDRINNNYVKVELINELLNFSPELKLELLNRYVGVYKNENS